MSAPRKYDQADGASDHKVKDVVLWGTAAITAGRAVALDLGDTTYGLGYSVVTADHDTAAHRGATIGVAVTTTTAAGDVVVRVGGYYTDAFVDGNTAAGDRLAIGTTAGQLIEVESATIVPGNSQANIQQALQTRIVALALEADTANLADIFIFDPGFFG